MKQEISDILNEFSNTLPHFPDGRINYSNSNKAPVITCFVKYKDEILLLKRSDKVSVYKGKWNTVAGYLDEPKPLAEKALEEVHEEVGITKDNVSAILLAEPYEFKDNEIQKTWIIHPILIELKNKPKIELDWEHTEYKWIKPADLKKFDIVPKLDITLRRALADIE